jgi:anti-sigma regulatory factor (Ser/Thr protein kinase)
MDIKKLIIAEIEKKGVLKMAELQKKFGFSRAYINRITADLINQGKILRLGAGRGSKYVASNPTAYAKAKSAILSFNRVYVNKNLIEDAVLEEIKKATGIFDELPKNIHSILSYAFLEIMNNAIEHSGSSKIQVLLAHDLGSRSVGFVIADSGVGVFQNILTQFNLPDEYSAILHLAKGKQTTDPARHSGQGIFFTSKMADGFVLRSSTKLWRVNNLIDDWFIEDRAKIIGTAVSFYISLETKRKINEVFAKYTSPDDFEFSKTKVAVKLYRHGKNLLSRSEARRIIFGLDKFKAVVLDFSGVASVGQGFVDEIYRVWQIAHPAIAIESINANANIEIMIKNTA